MSDFDFLYGGKPPHATVPIPPDDEVTVLIGMTGDDGVRGFVAMNMTREAFTDVPMYAVLQMVDKRAAEMIEERKRDRGTEGG